MVQQFTSTSAKFKRKDHKHLFGKDSKISIIFFVAATNWESKVKNLKGTEDCESCCYLDLYLSSGKCIDMSSLCAYTFYNKKI